MFEGFEEVVGLAESLFVDEAAVGLKGFSGEDDLFGEGCEGVLDLGELLVPDAVDFRLELVEVVVDLVLALFLVLLQLGSASVKPFDSFEHASSDLFHELDVGLTVSS